VGKTEKERGRSVRKRNHKMLGYTALVQAQFDQPNSLQQNVSYPWT